MPEDDVLRMAEGRAAGNQSVGCSYQQDAVGRLFQTADAGILEGETFQYIAPMDELYLSVSMLLDQVQPSAESANPDAPPAVFTQGVHAVGTQAVGVAWFGSVVTDGEMPGPEGRSR